jgi:hypothetical protein
VGDLVSTLVSGISDADSGALKGMAITGVHAGGTLYFSTNGGTTWTAASGLSNTNALLLASDSDTRVFYKANDSSGTISDAITFRAWDQTQNVAEGMYASTVSNGGKAEFSTATDTVSVVSTLPMGNDLDLGTDSGVRLRLINKQTSSDGKVYYYVSVNGDGISTGLDGINHNLIDDLFNGGADTTGTSGTQVAGVDTERSVIVNGYTLVLPTAAELTAATMPWPDPTNTGGSTWTNIFSFMTSTLLSAGNHTAVSFGASIVHTSGIQVPDTYDKSLVVQVLVPVAPVVMDLNRDGFMSYGQVTMDVNGDRILDTTQWAGAQDGVLVWDKFADGLVHDNSQYAFGQYATTFSVDAQGFARLASDLEGLSDGFDTNKDGVFDAADEKFAEFKVWQDADQDGVSDAGEVRSLADVGITQINLVSDGVQRTPAAGVTEAGRSTANLADGSTMLVADAAFAYSTATVKEVVAHVADQVVQAAEFENKPYELSAEELAQLGLPELAASLLSGENAELISEAVTALNLSGAGVAQLIEAVTEVASGLTTEELAALGLTETDVTAVIDAVSEVASQLPPAPEVCLPAAESSTYSLSNGQSLDLTQVLNDMSVNGIVKGLELVDMATDTSANVVSLSLADVLSMPSTDGVYKLMLTGAANDKVMLTEGEWTDTGNVVNQGGQNYAVYSGTNDSSAQLLIDQQMLQSYQLS